MTRQLATIVALTLLGCTAAESGMPADGDVGDDDGKADSASGPRAITGEAATPPSGVAQRTPFRFAARLDRPLAADQRVVLSLFSPDAENQWAWRDVEMTAESLTRYVLDEMLADHSGRYAYRYAIVKAATGAHLKETQPTNGPATVVDRNDRTPPSVLRSFPEKESVGVDPAEAVTFSFSEVVDPASVSAANVHVGGDVTTVASVRAFQNRVVVTFARPFDPPPSLTQTGVQNSVSIQGVKDLAGNLMAPYDLVFSVRGPLLRTFAVESRKYPGHCVAVKDLKRRFADPQDWNPVIEIEACVPVDDDLAQRWFFEKAPGQSGSGQIVWAQNYDYCLSKRQFRDPIIERCNATRAAQRFSLEAHDAFHLIHSGDGGCVAVGVVDAGEPNKVESSLCTSGLERNHWSIQPREMARLAPAFMLGKYNMRHAQISYENPVAGVSLDTEETRELVMYLYQTRASNQAQVVAGLGLEGNSQRGAGFASANPYFPRAGGTLAIPLPKPRSAVIDGQVVVNPEGYDNTEEGYHTSSSGNVSYFQQEVVTRWYSDVTNGQPAAAEVCAIKFADDREIDYELRTFPSAQAARDAGWTITHQYHCGACSTLQDLAVYMGIPDQTTPVRLCTKRGRADSDNLDEVKQCIMDSVGFTELCAESWAYNGIHTGQECRSQCMRTYGHNAIFWPRLAAFFKMVIAEKFDACPPEVPSDDPELREKMDARGCPLANEETGALNDCLWCDEKTSGPGFKYEAGRTRRGSGLQSEIPRPNDRLFYEANHTLYFAR